MDVCWTLNLCFHTVIDSHMRNFRFTIVLLGGLLFSTFIQAQQVEKSTYGVFALTNAAVETVTHGLQDPATVIIRNGIIEAVGPDVVIPADAQVIDCKGLTIYPGMIDAGTRLGL